jgi:cellulose synthase (UDP-forming)
LIDIFIPTYNENRDILERTIIGAKGQSHSDFRVWVLDDGRRQWVKGLADHPGVGYVKRDDNAHYKAGNLNNGLKHTRSLGRKADYIAVFDADFIAQPTFLKRTLTLMGDPKVAIVQTPQQFYNADPFQYAFPECRHWPDGQRFQFECVLPTRDACGIANCAGTSFLARASAVEQIGGFPTESISEDYLMSVKLRVQGMRTVFLNESLSFGLAPEGIQELLTQYGRWCLGLVQVIHTHWGAFSKRSMTLWERVLVAEGSLSWGLFSAVRVMFLVLPILFWFTGFSVIHSTGGAFRYYFFPVWLVQRTTLSWISRGTTMPIATDAVAVVSAPVVVRACLRALLGSKDQQFVVTKKGANRNSVTYHWHAMWWMLVIAILTVAGLVNGLFNPHAPAITKDFAILNYFWSYYNLAVLFVGINVCIERPKRRRAERFVASESVLLQLPEREIRARLRDIAENGVRVELTTDAAIDIGQRLDVEIQGVGPVAATVVRRTEGGFGLLLRPSDLQHQALVRKVYSPQYVHPVREGRFMQVCFTVLRRVVTG